MGSRKVVVTGGAGFLGSQLVHLLVRAGHHVIAMDDLSSGHTSRTALASRFIQVDVRDRSALIALFRHERP
ncbi:MAG: NAD-dependent epimerase/dehydratase family protein, partial [Myxococcales bacterium]|nr:NAD-dependent epimerase/dehydratase family protein [Myxococcales bacterium]